MLVSSPEFTENSEYGFAVAKIRALETRLIDSGGYTTLVASPWERFIPQLAELTGLTLKETNTVQEISENLEKEFTNTLLLVKKLLIEDEVRRLVALKYDYELLKFIIKQKKGFSGRIPESISMRANYPYPVLLTFLENGRVLDTGETIYNAYATLSSDNSVMGFEIDSICDKTYYSEVFQICRGYPNDFIEGYFRRKVDAHNIVTLLRMKLRDQKRSEVNKHYIPGGSIDVGYCEEGFDLNLDGFLDILGFSWCSTLLKNLTRIQDEVLQVALLEKALDEGIVSYLRESMFVTFGVEPVVSYLWKKELELKNLRTILFSKASGIMPEEIQYYVRNLNE